MVVIILILSKKDFLRFKQQDINIFLLIYNKYKDDIYCYLRYLTSGKKDEIEDLFQDTFLSALESVSRVHDRNKIDRWLINIATNKSNDSKRSLVYFKRRQA